MGEGVFALFSTLISLEGCCWYSPSFFNSGPHISLLLLPISPWKLRERNVKVAHNWISDEEIFSLDSESYYLQRARHLAPTKIEADFYDLERKETWWCPLHPSRIEFEYPVWAKGGKNLKKKTFLTLFAPTLSNRRGKFCFTDRIGAKRDFEKRVFKIGSSPCLLQHSMLDLAEKSHLQRMVDRERWVNA